MGRCKEFQIVDVVIERIETSDQGTFGILKLVKDGTEYSFFTGELPNKDNKNNISCIPTGTYSCEWTYSPKLKKKAYLIKNVPNREGTRIHSANLMGDDSKGFKRQLNGCIALGERLGAIDNQKALLLSKPAIRRFEDLTEGTVLSLIIS